ncbi:PAS domain S-box protein [Psychroserpens damuponensis]|uniref:PAS domain S-box protein n=1 Tax=Psychroserpens damuponensis TaxID=943936 RepID=UPI0013792DEB|nr:PAS domain S-box protein [Psychroserpens damuponensis]
MVQNHVTKQKDDAYLINKSGRQRMLSQNITKNVLAYHTNLNVYKSKVSKEDITLLLNEFETSHNYLYDTYKRRERNAKVDSLFTIIQEASDTILASSVAILNSGNFANNENSAINLSKSEHTFVNTMDAIVFEFQRKAEENTRQLQLNFYVLLVLSILLLAIGFFFLLMPTIKELILKNDELDESNKSLKVSKDEIKSNLNELKQLKQELEQKNRYNTIFVEQAAPSLAMLDKDMKYIAVSEKWKKDYNKEGQDIIGKSHYEVFPEIGEDWKAQHQKCLNGYIDTCEEAPFVREDGSVQWIFWDVRPWYLDDNTIGGLLMHTGDITHVKEQALDKQRIEQILKRTSIVARIGTWELDLETDELNFSDISKRILKLPKDYKVLSKNSLHLYKEGLSRVKIINAFHELVDTGKPFDLELEVVTSEGDVIWIRDIGQAEYVEGKCVKLFGVFQDITHIKNTEKEIRRKNQLLNFAEKINKIGNWEWDYKKDRMSWSSGLYTILEREQKDEIITIEELIKYVHPEDEEMHQQHVERTLENKTFDGDLIHRIITDKGKVKIIQVLGKVFTDENNEIISVVGSFQDITHSKDTEEKLLRQNDLLNFAEKITKTGHWNWNAAANVIVWSDNLYDILGYSKESIEIGPQTILDMTHPLDKEAVENHMQNTFKDKCFTGELIHRIITPKGTVKTLRVSGKVFLDDQGEIKEIVGATQDITSQKMAENKFRGLLESAPDAMIILNDQKRIHLINKQAENLFGYTASEIRGEKIEKLMPERIVENFKVYRDQYFSDPKSIAMGENRELIGINKAGKEFPIQISLSPLETDEGLLVSSAIRDISIQKQVERSIRNSKDNLELLAHKLKKQNIQLADFAHITSHNLRAPVSNLNSLIDMYYLSKDEDKDLVFNKFKKVINHLTEILNTLVEALKIKKENVSIEQVDFAITLNKTKEILAAQIIETDAIITADFEVVNKILYNKIYFESIFLNLVENAIKYKSKDRTPKIHLKTKLVEGHTVLEISDNGLGINIDRHKHKLFGLNKVFHRHPKAKGIGLFMTKLQIESLGGTIRVESEVNKGSTFIINFNK